MISSDVRMARSHGKRWAVQLKLNRFLLGAIHSTKIQNGPTGKRGPPQKVDQLFRNLTGWTEPIHWVLDRNFPEILVEWIAPLGLLLGLNFGKNSQSQKMFNLQRESSRNVTCCTAVWEDNRSLCLQALDIYGKFAPLMIHGCFHLAGFGKRC